jgi:hypothetical protein
LPGSIRIKLKITGSMANFVNFLNCLHVNMVYPQKIFLQSYFSGSFACYSMEPG